MKLSAYTYFNQDKFLLKTYQVFFSLFSFLLLLYGCAATATSSSRVNVALLEKWSGDYPVTQLFRLPAGQLDSAVGYIDSMETFLPIWRVYMPTEILPSVDFSKHIVVFTRNVQFYNNLSILTVTLTENTAEIGVLKTMSTRMIEDRAVLAMAVIPRGNITTIKLGDSTVAVQRQ